MTSERLQASAAVIAILALCAIALALLQLQRGSEGLNITTGEVGRTPITIFRPHTNSNAPVAVIAHGFAGSQQLMQPFAMTLARNGYIAVTFDFLGHGRNPEPMRGDITKEIGITDALLAELTEVAAVARSMPQSDGRLAVIGHSMASDIVLKFAQANPYVSATVAVSVFSRTVTAKSPRNLLVIVGALEPKILQDEALRIVGLAANGPAEPGQTYGSFANRTARRMVEARGVEHIGVLYSRDSLQETLDWLNGVFDNAGSGFIDARGKWLALLFTGIVALAWPLSHLLPPIRAYSYHAGMRWGPLLLIATGPALMTPLILWKLPTRFLPILLGDYLALHFLVYGLLTALAMMWYRRRQHDAHQARAASLQSSEMTTRHRRKIAVGATAVALFNIIAFGIPIDLYLFSFLPIPERMPLIAAVACGTIPYFIADETLTAAANRTGGYAMTKVCFLVSLALAILLNPAKLFFLAIIVPAILLLFIAFGVISRLSLRASGHPLPGAIANAVVFAWGIAVTFPMVVR